ESQPSLRTCVSCGRRWPCPATAPHEKKRKREECGDGRNYKQQQQDNTDDNRGDSPRIMHGTHARTFGSSGHAAHPSHAGHAFGFIILGGGLSALGGFRIAAACLFV